MRTLLLSLLCLLGHGSEADPLRLASLQWLRSQQGADGAWGGEQADLTSTALAVLAHLVAGYSPDQDPQLEAGMRWLVEAQDEAGTWSQAGTAAPAMTSLCLSEGLGAGVPDALALSLVRAVAAAVTVSTAAQLPTGAWSRDDTPVADPWVSLWQLQALLSARQCGFAMADEVVLGADGYWQAFGPPADANTASMVLASRLLLAAPQQPDERMVHLQATLLAEPVSWQGPRFFSRMFVQALALALLDTDDAAVTNRLAAIQAMLLEHRNPQGWWHQPPGGSESRQDRIRVTCLALLTLSLDLDVLPIWSR